MEWFKKLSTSSQVLVIGCALLTLSVLVLLVVGIATHEESGLLLACDTENGALDYQGACAPVQWERSQFPLTVSASTTNRYSPVNPHEATLSAIDLINSRLGFSALTLVTNRTSSIRVDLETAQEVGSVWMQDAGGGTLHRRDSGVLSCDIHTWNNGTLEMVDKALTHELGHCLGLAHDSFADSAMYGSVRPDGPVLSRLRLTDFDRSLLRKLYN